MCLFFIINTYVILYKLVGFYSKQGDTGLFYDVDQHVPYRDGFSEEPDRQRDNYVRVKRQQMSGELPPATTIYHQDTVKTL
jgi:hypothetical protein